MMKPLLRSSIASTANDGWRILVALSLLITAMTQASISRLPVSFDELVEHPHKYSGKMVSVRAYLVTSCAHCRDLWASAEAARDPDKLAHMTVNTIALGNLAQSLVLPKEFYERLKRQDFDGYVQITGTFQYVQMTRKTGARGFGWDRLADKQIGNITELRPLRLSQSER
jgi:hypothetical protein